MSNFWVVSNWSFGCPTYDTVVISLAKAHHGCPVPVGEVGDRSAVVFGSLLPKSIFEVIFGPKFTLKSALSVQ